MKKRLLLSLLALTLSFNAFSQTLVQSFYNKDYEQFKKLLNSETDLYQIYKGESVVGAVIELKNQELIDFMVNHPKFKVNKIYQSVSCGASECIFYLRTAICDAISNDNLDLVKTLLGRGATVDCKTEMYSISNGVRSNMSDGHPMAGAFGNTVNDENLAIARLIAEQVKNFNIVLNTHDIYKSTIPLVVCLIESIDDRTAYNPIFTELFLRSGIDINYTIPSNPNQTTCMKEYGLSQTQMDYARNYGFARLIDVAIRTNNLELVQWFFDKGAKVEKTGDKGANALYNAPSVAMVKLLVKNGVDINATLPGSKFNILQRWVKEADSKDFEELLKMGIDPNHKDTMGLSVQDYVMKGVFVPKNIKNNLKIIEKYQAASKK